MSAPRKPPLEGIRVIELAGIGPGPHAAQVLRDMGADVIRISRPGGTSSVPFIADRGKRSLTLDLRQDGAAQVVRDLCKSADILIEGNRPGVTERLGVGPADCHTANPALIYGRMTGWGQTGPWASMAGHDINYISITGALAGIGAADAPPPPPLNMIGDFGGGSMFLVAGVLAALIRAKTSGQGDVVDAAIVDGTHHSMSIIHALAALGQWSPARESNLLDGAAPFYRCYTCADGHFIAVGCIEPQFFAEMLRLLDIASDDFASDDFGPQNDRARWPAQHQTLEATFASQSRNHWAALFDGTDACVTPVLDYVEAAAHPHNVARDALTQSGPFTHPAPAPRFGTPIAPATDIAAAGSDSAAILQELGYDAATLARLKASGAIPASVQTHG